VLGLTGSSKTVKTFYLSTILKPASIKPQNQNNFPDEGWLLMFGQ